MPGSANGSMATASNPANGIFLRVSNQAMVTPSSKSTNALKLEYFKLLSTLDAVRPDLTISGDVSFVHCVGRMLKNQRSEND